MQELKGVKAGISEYILADAGDAADQNGMDTGRAKGILAKGEVRIIAENADRLSLNLIASKGHHDAWTLGHKDGPIRGDRVIADPGDGVVEYAVGASLWRLLGWHQCNTGANAGDRIVFDNGIGAMNENGCGLFIARGLRSALLPDLTFDVIHFKDDTATAALDERCQQAAVCLDMKTDNGGVFISVQINRYAWPAGR